MNEMMTQEEAMNMSNEQAVQILIPMRNMMCDQNGCPISDAVFALDKAIEALSEDRPQEWIPCGERLPDKSGEYLAYGIISHVPDHIGDQNIRRDTTVAYYSRSFNEWFGSGVEKVLAWQPKPEPWKGENCEVSCR